MKRPKRSIRDRVKELRRVKASELVPHPQNWRLHPPEQHSAMQAVLSEIGFAGASLVRELPDGRLQLIDGHLRQEVCGDTEIPVLVLDVDEKEAAKLLVTFDPLSAMAKTDKDALAGLIEQLEADTDQFADLVQSVGESQKALEKLAAETRAPGGDWAPEYRVQVLCRDEAEQKELLQRLHDEGYEVRALMV